MLLFFPLFLCCHARHHAAGMAVCLFASGLDLLFPGAPAEAASPLQAGFASVALSQGACVTGRRAHSLLLESRGYCQEPQKDVLGQVGSESEMAAWPGRSLSPAQSRTLGLHRSGSAGRPGVGLVSDAVRPPRKPSACSDSVPASWRGLEYAPFYGVD